MSAGWESLPTAPDWELLKCEGDPGQAEWCQEASDPWSWEAKWHQEGPTLLGNDQQREQDQAACGVMPRPSETTACPSRTNLLPFPLAVAQGMQASQAILGLFQRGAGVLRTWERASPMSPLAPIYPPVSWVALG